MKTLVEIQEKLKFNTDKHKMSGKYSKPTDHTYLPEYDKLFKKYKYESINILEIGVLDGSSLNLWAEYFPNAKIYGADIFKRIKEGGSFSSVKNKTSKYKNISLHVVDSVNEKDINPNNGREKLFEILGKEKFHIIIDDGDHKPTSQLKTFNNFIGKLHSDGLYIIEDIWDWDEKLNHRDQNTSQTGLEYLQENIPELEIINMNDRCGKYRDNILGIYKKTNN